MVPAYVVGLVDAHQGLGDLAGNHRASADDSSQDEDPVVAFHRDQAVRLDTVIKEKY